MISTYTISLHALNEFGVLARISLQFSRRRIKIERFEMIDNETGPALFRIVFKSDECVSQLIKQLRKIIELHDIAINEGDLFLSKKPTEVATAQHDLYGNYLHEKVGFG